MRMAPNEQLMALTPTTVVETITVRAEVPRHRDVKDCTLRYGKKVFRPDEVEARFQRRDGGPWQLTRLAVHGPDVLRSGETSDNQFSRRERVVETDPRWIEERDGSVDLFAWARDWATVELARINEVKERADLDSVVYLGSAEIDLDETSPTSDDEPV